jgi:hypothetical protein
LELVRNAPELVRRGSELVRNASELVRGGSELIRNAPELVRRGSELVRNTPELVRKKGLEIGLVPLRCAPFLCPAASPAKEGRGAKNAVTN